MNYTRRPRFNPYMPIGNTTVFQKQPMIKVFDTHFHIILIRECIIFTYLYFRQFPIFSWTALILDPLSLPCQLTHNEQHRAVLHCPSQVTDRADVHARMGTRHRRDGEFLAIYDHASGQTGSVSHRPDDCELTAAAGIADNVHRVATVHCDGWHGDGSRGRVCEVINNVE